MHSGTGVWSAIMNSERCIVMFIVQYDFKDVEYSNIMAFHTSDTTTRLLTPSTALRTIVHIIHMYIYTCIYI